MADTASLVVRVRADGVDKTNKSLKELEKSSGGAESAVKGLVAQAAGLISVGAAVNKLVATARQTDVLTASLVTMTGSTQNAALAFGELEKFAANTPYTLDQSVQAFTKLVSLGLTPSQRAIESYGNTAAAMGKDLTQMIEAVADASTGEFERLKEFGIKAKQQGDQVSFTFQGVTTTVGKNAAEIEGYLQGLGENQFAGAMANRMATLDGALSNLQDSWDGLFRSVAQSGTGDLIAEQVRGASAALDDLNAAISSGEALGYIEAWGGQWESTFSDMKSGLVQIDKLITETINGWGITASDTSSFMSDAFWQFPANIRALIQIATTEVAGFVDKAKVYGEAAAEALNPFSNGNWQANLQLELGEIDHRVNTLSASYLAQRDVSISGMNDQISKAKELRAEYDKVKAPVDLGQFKVGGDSKATGQSDQDKKRADAAAKREIAEKEQAQRYLDRLAQDNMTEIELIRVQEEEKIAIVAGYREKGLISEQEQQAAITEIHRTALDERVALEEEAMKRLDDANQKLFDEQIRAQKEKEASRQKTIDDGIGAQRDMTGDLKSVLGEQNALYKASAIVTATIQTYQAATGAMAAMSAIPIIGPALGIAAAGAAIAAGMAQVAAISGAREQGGYMSAGSAYQMAERGKAEVIVPVGNSRAKTMSQMKDMMGGSNGGASSIVIVNQTTGRIDSVEQEQDSEGRMILTIKELLVSETYDQSSGFSKARRATRGQPGY